jgi:hypothetical protein
MMLQRYQQERCAYCLVLLSQVRDDRRFREQYPAKDVVEIFRFVIFIRSTLLKAYGDCTLLKTYSDACSISRLLKAYAYC